MDENEDISLKTFIETTSGKYCCSVLLTNREVEM